MTRGDPEFALALSIASLVISLVALAIVCFL